jgi:hypothetical protein
MTERDPHVEQIVAYLMGELPEPERALLEDQFVAHEETFRQILAIEAELYDSYVRGSLPAERRARFEQRFLNTPEQMERLAFSRALLQSKSRAVNPRRSTAMWVAGIAALLALALVLWRTQSTPRGPRVSPPLATNRTEIVVAFALRPGPARDGADAGNSFDIPSSATLVRLMAGLETGPHPSYHATLRTPDGIVIWTQNGIHADPDRKLTLEIPASLLAAGHYVLTLSGDAPGKPAEDVADYSIRIRR